MGKMTGAPRYNVVSLRISDEELAAIHSLRDGADQSISDFMRKVLSVFIRDACCTEKGESG